MANSVVRNATRRIGPLSAALAGVAAAAALLPGPGAQAQGDGTAFYRTKVQPVLVARCLPCHTGPSSGGKLDLTRRAALLKGGESGPAVDLKAPQKSLLLRLVSYHETRKMPPQGKLPQAQIDALTRWVALGVPLPESKDPAPAAHAVPQVDEKNKRFWSFQPVRRPAVPRLKNPVLAAEWVRNPIDAFVVRRLETHGLTPAAPANKTALLRRVTYDLTGLPPTIEETTAFLADTAPDAYEKVVDRLLASPHYGERWGRHWLDLVRYAETNSFERDDAKPFAFRYRDYVIRSFNDDKPYDRFLKEQLAGDELDTITPDTITATGYFRLGQWDDEPADPEQARYDELDDIVAVTGQTMLGLTVNCARCHDHKIDPIPTKDYYRLLAFFQGVNRYGLRGHESVQRASLRPVADAAETQQFAEADAAFRKRLGEFDAQLKAIEAPALAKFAPVDHEEFRDEGKRVSILKKFVDGPTATRYEELTRERNEWRDERPVIKQALAVTEAGPNPPPTHILMRGNPHVPGDPVTPGFLSILSPPEPIVAPPRPGAQSSGRRRVLADWIASQKNPLTARVMANRLFQFHFGRGIVRSSSNFGLLGTPPTHPELLDWLASELVRQGWRLKPIHRLLVLSSAYRMSSQADPKALAKDPENDLLWRFDMRRLEAEEVRDSILAVNGTLDPTLFGPSIYPTIPAEVHAGQSIPGYGWPTTPKEKQARRSIYVHVKRSLPLPLLASFDMADTDFTCPVRFATTQPTQALSMLNSAFVGEQAQAFAQSLIKSAPDSAGRVRLGLRRTLQRTPSAKEIALGTAFLEKMRALKVSDDEALRRYCILLLNLNEFLYLD
jgi:hypothetical protein